MSAEFVDTNVLVYAYDNLAGRKHETARTLIERLWSEGTGRISIQVLQELYVTLTRKVPAIPRGQALEIVEDLGAWPVHEPRVADVVEAARIAQRHQLSFWDAMIVRSAIEMGAAILWSEDLAHGSRIQSLEIRSPFA